MSSADDEKCGLFFLKTQCSLAFLEAESRPPFGLFNNDNRVRRGQKATSSAFAKWFISGSGFSIRLKSTLDKSGFQRQFFKVIINHFHKLNHAN